MQNTRSHLHLIWADKIVLTLAILFAFLTGFAWLLVALAAGAAGANHVLASVGTDGAVEVTAALLALWAAFRAVDFIAHGATYKLFHAGQDSTVELPTGGNLLAH